MPKSQPSDSLPILLSDLGVLVNRRWTAVLVPFNVTPVEFRLLSILVDRGPCTAVEIGGMVPTDASFISRMVQRLAEKELLARRRSRTDRRVVTLRATDQGEKLVHLLAQPLLDMETELLQGIPKAQLRQTRLSISSILANLDSMIARRGPHY